MATEPLGPLMMDILACANEALTTPVALVTLAPGAQVAWDDCCEGELYVRVTSLSPAPVMTRGGMEKCVQVYTVSFATGVIRCAHTVDDQANFPTAQEMTADTLMTYQDRADVLQALACCAADLRGVSNLRVGTWTPQGPNGGCVGGEWAATFNLDACVNCDEEAQPI